MHKAASMGESAANCRRYMLMQTVRSAIPEELRTAPARANSIMQAYARLRSTRTRRGRPVLKGIVSAVAAVGPDALWLALCAAA